MRLDLRHQAADRLVLLDIGRACRKRLAGQLRRAHLEIEPAGAQRQHHQRDDGDQAPVPGCLGRRQRAGARRLGVRRADQPARHLDLGGLRLDLADLSGRAVARNLLELIAIDDEIAPGTQRSGVARKRPQHGEHRHRGHQREQDP